MPPVATCGRFDNAPAHIIIESTFHRSGSLGSIEHIERRENKTPETEAARIEKERLSAIKADLRKAREAIERLQKMDIMRQKEIIGKRKRMVDVRPGETKNQRRARFAKMQRDAQYAPAIAALPPEFVPVYKMDLPVGLETAYVYLRAGYVKGIKIGQVWYASHADMLVGVEAAKARFKEAVQKNIDRNRKRGTR